MFKGDFPKKMKVSPIAEIPHKSKAFRSILDLSFSLKLTPHGRVPSVNDNSKKMDLGGAIHQIGNVRFGPLRLPETSSCFFCLLKERAHVELVLMKMTGPVLI